MNTQFLCLRIKRFLSDFIQEGDLFIYSFQDDPNICQLSFHKSWENLVFAWIQPGVVFLFKVPKQDLMGMNVSYNHADKVMIQKNLLFKNSIRLSNLDIQKWDKYLVDILE